MPVVRTGEDDTGWEDSVEGDTGVTVGVTVTGVRAEGCDDTGVWEEDEKVDG